MNQVMRNKVYKPMFDDGCLVDIKNEHDLAICLGAELAFRLGFLEAAREVGKWVSPNQKALDKARIAKRIYRGRMLSTGRIGDDKHYSLAHALESSKHRGRVQAMEMATQDWGQLSENGLSDDFIRCHVINLWLEKVEFWAKSAIPLDRIVPAFFPVESLSHERLRNLGVDGGKGCKVD